MTRAALIIVLLLGAAVHAEAPASLPVQRVIELFSAAPGPADIDRTLLGMPLRSLNVQVVDRLANVDAAGSYAVSPEDAPALRAAMCDPQRDAYARLCAARYLLDLDDPEARAQVQEHLQGDDSRLVHNAAAVLRLHVNRDATRAWGVQQMLRAIGDDRLVGQHRPFFDDRRGDAYDDRSNVFDEICWDLGVMRVESAGAALMAVLERRPQVEGAAIALGQLGDVQAQAVLLRTLVDEQGRLRAAQAKALGVLRCREAVPVLLAHLQRTYDDGSRYHQRVAIEALGHIGDPRAAEPLRQYLKDDAAAYRSEAQLALVLVSSAQAPADLIQLLQREPRRSAQGKVIDALRQFNDPATVPALSQMVRSDRDPWLRAQCVALLGAVGDDAAIEALIDLLRQPSVTLQWPGQKVELHQVVVMVLEQVSGQTLGDDVGAWESWRAGRSR